MPLPDFPVGLPYAPRASAFARTEHHRPVLRTEVEDGPDIMRVQSNTRLKKFSYQLLLTDAQYATWEAFAEVTLLQATQHFMMLVPVVGETFVSRRVYIEGAVWSDTQPEHGLWEVSFVLCVFPAA